MSGTSMDGVSAAVVDLAGDTIQLIASSTTSYPNKLRADLQTLVDPDWRGSLTDIQALDLGVAAFYVECAQALFCLLYTSPSPRDLSTSRMPSSA